MRREEKKGERMKDGNELTRIEERR